MISQRETITDVLKSVLIECATSETIILLDGKWYALLYGCDTFDHLRDELLYMIKKEKKEEGNHE